MEQFKKIQIEKLDHYGRGISHIDNTIVFIFNALPLEIVDIEIIAKKKKYWEAKVMKWRKKSPKRVEPICPYYGKCGGCDLLHMEYEEQLLWKREKVIEILEKYANISASVVNPVLESPMTLGYRNKVTFQNDQGLGFFEKNTNHIVPIDYCLLCSKKANDILSQLRTNHFAKSPQVCIKTPFFQENAMIIGELDSKFSYPNTVVLKKDTENKNIYETIKNWHFQISGTSFFQVNTLQMIQLYQLILEDLQLKKNEVVLDLYCGTGTIGIFLSPYAKKVIGIEKNAQAVMDGKENIKYNHCNNVELYVGDLTDGVNVQLPEIDVLIVDPPRGGLSSKTKEQILSLNVSKMIYVSCDPMTMARDLSDLKEQYMVEQVDLVDMFPQTSHIECVALLCLKNTSNFFEK